MKRKIALMVFLMFASVSCSNDSSNTPPEDTNTILGRWHLVGFEQTVMYDFKEDLRYTIYATNGEFGPTETSAIPNPNTWYFEGENLIIDHNFGNISTLTLNFRCNGNVVDFFDENGTLNSTLFREGYDIANCN